MKFACLLANGFEETEMVTVVDLLRRAKIEVDLVSIHELKVTGSHGNKGVVSNILPVEDMPHDANGVQSTSY